MHRRLPIRTRNPKRYNSIEPGAFERSRIAVPNERDPPAGPDRGVWVQLGPDLALEGEGVSPRATAAATTTAGSASSAAHR